MKLAFEILPELEKYKAPSNTTIKRWMQKVGYHKLTRPKIIADDWIVIIDASIQMGNQQCLVVIGCRQNDLPKGRPLTLEDFEVLGLRIASKVNSDLIAHMFDDISLRVGKIKCVCSDKGSDILLGFKKFKERNPEIKHISDTAHRVANFLKGVLEKNKQWEEFRKQVTQSRRQMQRSLVVGALPPSVREKSRYMNVGPLIQWAADMLMLLDNEISSEELNYKELKKYLGWLSGCREDIYYWCNLVLTASTARELVRSENIHINIAENFEQAIFGMISDPRELEFAKEISMFLLEQSQGIKPGEHLIGSSEIIESFFGKLKYMENEQTAFGFTSLVLASLAYLGPTDCNVVKEAIHSVKLREINTWAEKEIGRSIQSHRKTLKLILKNLREKIGRKLSGIYREKVVGF